MYLVASSASRATCVKLRVARRGECETAMNHSGLPGVGLIPATTQLDVSTSLFVFTHFQIIL